MKKVIIVVVAIIAVIIIGIKIIPSTKNIIPSTPAVNNGGVNNGSNSVPPVVNPPKKDPIKEEPVACTMDAKQCPDGSYVGRTGPKCEFAMCPTSQSNNQTSAWIGQRILNNGVYITPIRVTEDSRCPSGTECIWAGTLKLLTKLEVGQKTTEMELTLDTMTTFNNKRITLIDASPKSTQVGGATTPVMAVYTFSVN